MGNCFLLAAVGWSLTPLGSAQERAEAEAKFASFSEAHCLNCHDAETHKGGLNLEALATDFGDRKAFETWVKVHDQMASGEMPPKKKAQPTPEAKGAVLAWLAQALREAGAARQEREGRTRYRRLTRVEYENTLRDLLALPNLEVKEMLPADAEAHGFDNNGEALTVSYVQMNRYLEAADAALDEALKLGPKPETEHQHDPALEVHDLTLAFHIRNGPHQGLELPNAVGLLRQTKPGQHPWLWNTFKVWVAGEYRLRFKLHAFDFEKGAVKAADRARGVLVYANTGQNKRWIASGEAAANAGEASVLEIQVYLHKGEEIELYFPDLARATGNLEQFSGPGAAIEWLEAEGPLLDSWPPESQRRLLGDLPVVPWTAASGLQLPPAPVEISGFGKRAMPKANEKVTRFMAVSRQPAEDAERLLRSFTERAFRRTVADEEVQRYVKLVQAKLDQKVCFQEALQEGCKAVLCSPDFLYLQEKPGRLDGYALASRLSYFLWSSMPDQTLLDLAADGTLGHPPVLLAQVDRMLADGKAHRFTENFTGQWLGLRGMRATDPDEDLYPEFTDLLLTSMVKETQAFFEEMLRGDLGVSHVVSADFAMLNEPLARLYGIEGVAGPEIRRVPLPASSPRGGFLTQGSILKVSANGTTTSPVTRGVWILRNLLGQPPALPPPGTPAIEPDVRGATTIREQLAKHRSAEACASCHAKIDPPGFALESFDVIGGWRDRYRALDQGSEVTEPVRGQPVKYKMGLPVDASGEAFGGQKFHDIAEFRRILLENREQLARNLTEKLLVYATGAEIQFADRAEVEAILAKAQPGGYGLRTLIREVVASPVFQKK